MPFVYAMDILKDRRYLFMDEEFPIGMEWLHRHYIFYTKKMRGDMLWGMQIEQIWLLGSQYNRM